MKKTIFFLLVTLLFPTVVCGNTLPPQDLIFTPQGEGKFIYCNNDEAIWHKDLSDTSNPNPMYIMNNDNLTKDKYSMFISHANHTKTLDQNNHLAEIGFDIELDVQFVAKQDAALTITAVGFDAQRLKIYEENGNLFKTLSNWDLIDGWADYKQVPIYTINSSEKFIPMPFTPVEINLQKGEEIWLSQFIDNYSTVTFLKPVHILTDFEITEGVLDVNIAALKHNGKLRDRSHHSKDAKRGIYYRDRQYKGIAHTLPAVNASLSYTIDDTIPAGTLLPVTVYNQYNPDGNTVNKWGTNINPQEDIWSRNSAAESDMLSFVYDDGEKLKYYRSNIPQSSRNPLWIFDVFHSDIKESPNGVPNYKLSQTVNNIGNGCNLGNYGVSTNYHVSIHNAGSKTRYFYYKLDTMSTNLVILKDQRGRMVHDFISRKKPVGKGTEDIMAAVELKPHATTAFTIEVTLPPNYPGGMGNSFEISDLPFANEFYPSDRAEVTPSYEFTGREYVKWYDGKLYFSDDCENWTEQHISSDAAAIFEGQWNNYEIRYFDNVYAVRWNAYDAAPYFYNDALNFFNKVYYFDENFDLLTTHYFYGYPDDMAFYDGKIVTTVEGRAFFTDLPNLAKTITVQLEGNYLDFDVNPIIEQDKTLVPIRALFEAMGAKVDWIEKTQTAVITTPNRKIEFTVDSHLALVNGSIRYMDVPPKNHHSRTLVPIRFISESLGYTVTWDDVTKTVKVNVPSH